MCRLLAAVFIACLPVLASAAQGDLAPWDHVTVAADAYAARDVSLNKTGIYVQVHNDYANTLSCDLALAVRLERDDGGVTSRVIRIRNLSVFPKAAFGFESSFPVDVQLAAGLSLAEDYAETVEASCSGWDASQPLPESLCRDRKLNPGHAQTCKMLSSGQKLYPLERNGAWLGSCRCD